MTTFISEILLDTMNIIYYIDNFRFTEINVVTRHWFFIHSQSKMNCFATYGGSIAGPMLKLA